MANPSVTTPIVNQNVSISDPSTPANALKPNADGSLNVKGVAGTFEATQQSNAADQTFVEATANPLSGDLSGYLRIRGFLCDGTTHTTLATVAQFHNADNQALGAGNGLYTGGVTQILNSAGNLDRQRETSADQVPARGIITGAAQFAQEVLVTTTTTVSAAATTATLTVANTTGFQVGGVCNFEPSTTNVATGRYEAALITAVVANTSVSVSFPTGGALFTHTQPYLIQTYLYNQERDFSGEQQAAQGIGAAIATEFESNSGGPPLTTGLSAGWTLDADRNIQGKNNAQMAISSTTAGDTLLTFTNNPWTNANPLIVGQSVVLSATANGAAVEQVIVSKNNKPVTGAGPITVNLVNPVVTSASTFATFDAFGLNVPATASPLGTEDNFIWLYNAAATDPKRPLIPLQGAVTTAQTAPASAIATVGIFTSNANQPALTTGQSVGVQTTPDGALRTAPQRPATGDILAGFQTFTSTTAATTIITVPAGRTWVGTVTVTCSCSTVAASTTAGQARGVISTAGTNVTPAAGSYFAVQADSGANAASGLVGSQGQNSQSILMTVTAPVGNTVTVQVTTTQAGTVSRVDASAIGNLQ